jgi:hypothetical protein
LWKAFSISSSRFLLRAKDSFPQTPRQSFKIGKITKIEARKVVNYYPQSVFDNPFKLEIGAVWYLVDAKDPSRFRQESQFTEECFAVLDRGCEQWDALQEQWAGLTSHLIQRLGSSEDDSAELTEEEQMTQQIGDLSAAGGNLFSAVVELQRLRASSERKFRRLLAKANADQGELQEEIRQLQLRLADMERPLPPIPR